MSSIQRQTSHGMPLFQAASNISNPTSNFFPTLTKTATPFVLQASNKKTLARNQVQILHPNQIFPFTLSQYRRCDSSASTIHISRLSSLDSFSFGNYLIQYHRLDRLHTYLFKYSEEKQHSEQDELNTLLFMRSLLQDYLPDTWLSLNQFEAPRPELEDQELSEMIHQTASFVLQDSQTTEEQAILLCQINDWQLRLYQDPDFIKNYQPLQERLERIQQNGVEFFTEETKYLKEALSAFSIRFTQEILDAVRESYLPPGLSNDTHSSEEISIDPSSEEEYSSDGKYFISEETESCYSYSSE